MWDRGGGRKDRGKREAKKRKREGKRERGKEREGKYTQFLSKNHNNYDIRRQ